MAEKTMMELYTELYEDYQQQVEETELPLKKLLEYQELLPQLPYDVRQAMHL